MCLLSGDHLWAPCVALLSHCRPRAGFNEIFEAIECRYSVSKVGGVEIASQIGIARSDVTFWVCGFIGVCKHGWSNLAPKCCDDGLFFVFCVSCHLHRHAFGIPVLLEIGGLRFALQQREWVWCNWRLGPYIGIWVRLLPNWTPCFWANWCCDSVSRVGESRLSRRSALPVVTSLFRCVG